MYVHTCTHSNLHAAYAHVYTNLLHFRFKEVIRQLAYMYMYYINE